MSMSIWMWGSLHLLHALISIIIPGLLLISAIAYRIILFQIKKKRLDPIARLTDSISQLEGRTLDNWPSIHSEANQLTGFMADAFDRLDEDSQQLYRGRWLPDTRESLPFSAWLTAAQKNSLSVKPAATLLSIGILCTLSAMLIQQPLPVSPEKLGQVLVILPLLAALVAALSTIASARHTEKMFKDQLDAFHLSVGRHVPVFNDQTGVAELVDSLLESDSQMDQQLQEFTQLTQRLAESDMADGIRRSVEQVLTESVAPSLQQSTRALGQLAEELTHRQEKGMEALAGQFAEALSSEMAVNLQPVNREITQMGRLMDDVKNYVEVAMRAMETVREQSGQLQQSLTASLEQFATSHETMQSDFSSVRESMTELKTATAEMASLYEGNTDHLAGSLNSFSEKLHDSIENLSGMTRQAIETAERSQKTAAGHQDAAEKQAAIMSEQAEQFSTRLQKATENMLQQVQHETEAVAAHTGQISQQVQELNTILSESIDGFTRGSAEYVQRTLNQFDENLAEIVTRLTQTATEIQDAVDALPAAIQRSAQYGP
jgi:methyl-accepting chemotaxis protein